MVLVKRLLVFADGVKHLNVGSELRELARRAFGARPGGGFGEGIIPDTQVREPVPQGASR